MRLGILYNIFIRDFKKQKKRMLLTLLAILWGTMSIMLLLGFGEGLRMRLMQGKRGLGEGIIIVWGGQTSIPYKGFGKGRRIPLHKDDIEFLKKNIPEIKNIGGEYMRWGQKIKYKDITLQNKINGIYPCYEEMRNFRPDMGGRMINRLDMNLKRRVAFLGNETKRELFGDDDAVGNTIFIRNVPFKVIGIMIEKFQMGSYHGTDEDNIMIPATTFEAMYGDPYLDNIVYQPEDPQNAPAVEKRLFEVMGGKYKFDPADDQALSLWDVIENSKLMDNILLGIQIFLGIIGALTLLIAGVGVANIMYVSIKERTREIGIKMALGSKKGYILIQFLMEAMGITIFGGLLGMAISYIATELFKRVPIQSDVLDFMGRPTVSLEIGIIVVLILGVVGLISGFFPALKATSVSPVEALRYE